MKMQDLCDIGYNKEDADFWVKSFGSKESVGTVHKVYNPKDIGIKVVRTDVLNASYLYYLFEYLKMSNYFDQAMDQRKTGCKLTLECIKNITFQQ